MDRLDELVAVAEPLLRRVDRHVTDLGAPAGHPVWTQVRRMRVLPGDAVRTVAALRPADLDDAAPRWRRQARDYAEVAESLPAPGAWSGEAADAYAATRHRMVEHLSRDPDGPGMRLAATADLGDALADWMRRTRAELAGALADVLVSAEAVLLADPAVTADLPTAAAALAAADIADHLLGTVADAYDTAEALLAGSAHLA